MFMNLNKSGRILGVAFALAVIIPIGIAEAAAGRGGRGGGNGGGGGGAGGDGGGEGGGPGPGETPLSFIINTNDDKAPPCTANGCYQPPRITYIVKKDNCEIRTCETENGVRKCSTQMTDMKVCLTKRS